MGLVMFSIVTGIAIAVIGDDAEPLLKFLQSVSIVMMRITTWIIHLSPVGVCFLVAGQVLGADNEDFRQLGWYIFVVILGHTIHGLIVLPLIYTIICRKLPFR